jgi:hypothetical protein
MMDISFNKTDHGYTVFQENVKISVYTIFNKENVFYFLCFLAIYFVIFYFFIGYHNNSNSDELSAFSNTLDIIVLFIIIILSSIWYLITSQEDKNLLFGKLIKATKKFFEDPTSILHIILLILIFYITVFICRIPMTKDTKPVTVMLIEHYLLLILIPIIFFDLFKYLFGIDLVTIIFDKIYSLWLPLPDEYPEDASNNSIPIPNIAAPVLNPNESREVFNISNNLYTYEEGQAICKSYDSRLATYEEVEDSYNDGAEWCNYGWSEDQMILFPTQKATWDKLQQTKNNKNDCGRPGVNGGHMTNPTMQFGVNCFGKKPKGTVNDLAQMAAKNNPVIPKTQEEEVLDAKVKYWTENKDKMLKINSFNLEKWSEF